MSVTPFTMYYPFFLFSEWCPNHLLQFDNKFLDIEELYIIDHIELLKFYSEIILNCFLSVTQLLQLKYILLEILELLIPSYQTLQLSMSLNSVPVFLCSLTYENNSFFSNVKSSPPTLSSVIPSFSPIFSFCCISSVVCLLLFFLLCTTGFSCPLQLMSFYFCCVFFPEALCNDWCGKKRTSVPMWSAVQ